MSQKGKQTQLHVTKAFGAAPGREVARGAGPWAMMLLESLWFCSTFYSVYNLFQYT
jgi:hypothetical protein